MFKLLSSTAAAITLCALASTSYAQVIPRTVEPGKIGQRYQIESRPTVTGEPLIQIKDRKGQKRLSGGTSFMMEAVSFEGNEAICDDRLKEEFGDRFGQDITLSGLQTLVDDVTAYYRNEGFILSRAILPQQRIGDGVVKIKLIEGYINDVTFTGDISKGSLAEEYADKLRSKALNVNDLERYLLLMDDLSGMTARATLSAAPSGVGGSDMAVSLTQKTYSFRANVNNRGSRYLGPAQGDLSVQSHNLIGQHETIGIRTIQTLNLDELAYYEASYSQPVGSEGTVVRGLINYTDTEPGNALAPLRLQGDSVTARLDATHPFIRSRRENLLGTIAFTYRNAKSDTFGLSIFEDRVRTLSGRLAYDFLDNLKGINQLAAGVTHGVDIFGANDANDLISRANADSSFTKFNFDVQRLQSIYGPFAAQVTAAGQFSLDPLHASEEFSVGSTPLGSAYDPSELSGDNGFGVRGELHYNADYSNQWINNYQLYSFYDYGKVWNRSIIAGEDDAASLASAGLGVRAGLLDNLRGDIELAMPLTKRVAAENTKGDDTRIFFNLTYNR
ncbi:MAG: ShlB/FhaC/HecB family hemolysin secretion/activation protein [Rickettsiales bacterium]|nr:ShlB/FhaC/HecB family hemolysin secretion/activation protein [Rickettsiales bacterium]